MHYNKSNFGMTPMAFSGLFGDILNGGLGKVFHDDNREYVSAPVNIKENDKAYELNIIAPGLSKEDFKISIDKNVLNISFDKKEDKQEEGNKWIRKEYQFHSFKRSFTLNDKIDQGSITAKYADGILNINLQKKEAAESTTKEITVG